jgi:asparagine synthase (glutamine-hydrolysing)
MDTSLYLLFGQIRRHATVALSGEAADEVFLGYPWFHNDAFAKADTFPWLLVTGAEAAMPLHPDLRAKLRIPELRADTYSDALRRVPHRPGDSPTERRQRELQHLSLTRWLRQLLHRKDRLSMAHGLEVRVPYCDHRLVDYLFSVPWPVKSFDGREKSLLRSASSGICPDSVLTRPKNHYPTTHHPQYNAGLQSMAAEAFASYPQIADIADRRYLEPLIRCEPEELDWASRLGLERVVDLSLWLEIEKPDIRI